LAREVACPGDEDGGDAVGDRSGEPSTAFRSSAPEKIMAIFSW